MKTQKEMLGNHDKNTELNWLRGYIQKLEDGFKDLNRIIDKSEGVIGYHLNGELISWNDLLNDSWLGIALIEYESKKEANRNREQGPVPFEHKSVLYIKTYKHHPCSIAYTPVYGGTKYVQESAELNQLQARLDASPVLTLKEFRPSEIWSQLLKMKKDGPVRIALVRLKEDE